MPGTVDPAAPTTPSAAEEPADPDYVLPLEGIPDARRRELLDRLDAYLGANQARFLGYQVNQKLDYQADLGRFLDYHINNVGDPFEDSNFTMHTRWLERAVLNYYATLWSAKLPTGDPEPDPEAYWGYVLTMGSSEGNVYALWNARDYLSGKTLKIVSPGDSHDGAYRDIRQLWVQDTPPANNANAYSPVAFYSEDTHYSVAKALRVLGIPNFYEVGTERYPFANPLAQGEPWPREVPSAGGPFGPGSIDIHALLLLVEFFASMGHPILVNLNYGSTFKGAYDDVETICAALRDIFARYGLDERRVRYGRDPETGEELVDVRTGYWITVDGALSASYAPFLRRAIARRKIVETDGNNRPIRLPKFDFDIPEVSSIVTSGHKYPGAPWPCGVFMTKRGLQMLPPDKPAVIGSGDTTFGGSRSAFSPIVMWDSLARLSEDDQIDMVVEAVEVARFAEREIGAIGDNVWDVRRTPWSLSVWFKIPDPQILQDFSLATVPVGDSLTDNYAHLYVMPHVTRELVTKLVQRLRASAPSAPEPGAFRLADHVDDDGRSPDIRNLAQVPFTRRGL
jgi:histidine decarboxylase